MTKVLIWLGGMVKMENNQSEGTFAVPRYYLDPIRPEYRALKALFAKIEWPQKTLEKIS